MLKNISSLAIKIGERTYQLLCDIDSPLHEVKDVLFQFMKYVGQVEDNAKAAQEQALKESQILKPEEVIQPE